MINPASIAASAPVPCIVREDGIAEEDSLAENIQRAPLHPLDQFRAFDEVKRSEENARSVQTFLDSIIENIPNMVFVKDAADLRFISLNKAGEELLGIKREVMIGKNDYDFFSKEEAAWHCIA